jgi:hypothetical protein
MTRRRIAATFLAIVTSCAVTGIGTADDRDADRVLIVTDESDRMRPLAAYLKAEGGIDSVIVDYAGLAEDERVLPGNLSEYGALVGYIHGDLNERTEIGIIEYTRNGGRFVAVHHMVSSGKKKNRHYFRFLGVHMDDIELAREPSEPDSHYMWREPVEKVVVNLAPGHYITSRGISWPETVDFDPTDVPGAGSRRYPAITMRRTEVYSNVKRTDGNEKTLLLGYIYTDDRNGVSHSQAIDGWIKPADEGHVVYLQPGHFVEEFTDTGNILNQLILNAVTWNPRQADRPSSQPLGEIENQISEGQRLGEVNQLFRGRDEAHQFLFVDVGESGHEYQDDVRVEGPDLTARIDSVDPGRHANVQDHGAVPGSAGHGLTEQ